MNGYAHIFKGARSGNPGAGGVAGMAKHNSIGGWTSGKTVVRGGYGLTDAQKAAAGKIATEVSAQLEKVPKEWGVLVPNDLQVLAVAKNQLGKGMTGQYTTVRSGLGGAMGTPSTIRLDVSQSPAQAARVVTHELSHAIELGQGWSRSSDVRKAFEDDVAAMPSSLKSKMKYFMSDVEEGVAESVNHLMGFQTSTSATPTDFKVAFSNTLRAVQSKVNK